MAKTKIDRIANDVRLIKQKLIEKVPTHFSSHDVVRSFFGALLMGLTFVLKGQLFRVSLALKQAHLTLIVISTLVILTGEIYFIGYRHVSHGEKKKRGFGQFWLKRITTFTFIALIVSFLLVYLYGIDLLAGSITDTLKVIIAVFMPCAIGAGLADLLKEY